MDRSKLFMNSLKEYMRSKRNSNISDPSNRNPKSGRIIITPSKTKRTLRFDTKNSRVRIDPD